MTTGIGQQMHQHARTDGRHDEVTLTGILGRLSRLEHEGFSYGELLDDFASRRRVGPLKEKKEEDPAKHVLNAAEEADEIVQAYLSLTDGGYSVVSTNQISSRSDARLPFASSGSAVVSGRDMRRESLMQQDRKPGMSRTQQLGPENSARVGPARGKQDARVGGGGGVLVKQNVGSQSKIARQLAVNTQVDGFTEGDGYTSGQEAKVIQEVRQNRSYCVPEHCDQGPHVGVLASSLALRQNSGGERASSSSDPWCPTESRAGHDSLNYYPSRPKSVGASAVVSLISPRTSKRIRRLPRPVESQIDDIERVEHAARTFSAQELKRQKRGGLYSMIGRRSVGLIESDIDDLTATTTGRAEVLAAAKRKDVARSLANRSDGALAKLLSPQGEAPLPTIRSAYFHEALGADSGTAGQDGIVSPSALGSPKRLGFHHPPILQHNRRGKSNEQGASAADETAATRSEQGLETSERVRILGVKETQHRKNLRDNLRRLRVLLGEAKDGTECLKIGSPSLFSVNELRMIEVFRTRQRRPDGFGLGGVHALVGDNGKDQKSVEERDGDQRRPVATVFGHQKGPAAELAVGGNNLLRNLAKALFVSIQSRIEKELLFLGFRKWEATSEEGARAGYVDAILLVQRYLRRTLAVTEASERRRLRDNQIYRARSAVELVVQQKQTSALELQRWTRGQSGRRRAKERRRLIQATRMVQRAIRQRRARTRARRWRAEQRRIREAEAKEEQREKELLETLRKAVTLKVEALARQEAFSEERGKGLQERFRREGAATRIQILWKFRVLKRNLSALVRIGKRTRAIRIQRAMRVCLAKRELRRRREAFNIRFASEIAAAITIQSLVRGRIARNRVDEKRFRISKEQLVSTMDAERALRIRTVEVPRIKAIAAREGSILSAEGKGKPYIIDPVALKVLIADKRRAMNPWQDSVDRKAATKIQARFRGYRQVVRIRRMRVQRRRQDAENRREGQFRAANNLQRVFRGRRARVEAKSRRYGLRAVRVQKVWRGFLGRRAAADKRQRIQAATVLQRRLRGAQARSFMNRMRGEAVTTSAPAIAIQASARRYLARRRFNRMVREIQIEWELSTMATEMCRFCAVRARLRVIVEGASASSCRGDGVTQFIFRKLAAKRSGEEGSGSFRLEGRAFAKLFASTPGVFTSSFHATDIDLIFARVKDKDEKTLTYAQFAAGLNAVAATLFPEAKRFRDFVAFKAKAARLLELVDGKILRAPGAAEYQKFCKKAGERFLFRSACKIQTMMRGYLAREKFEQRGLESARMARIELEAIEAVKIQAIGRRYCARCLAIRVAQVRIAKYIDPIRNLPYWVNPVTGVTTWSKPKVFGAADVEHAMMVATSKTEHLVKCSVCDVKPVKRMCTSCRDSYCEDCFQALHGKGKRRTHVAPVVHICCVCNYQHASRLCETCTFKTSSTCAYCDVCFFNRHPGLDHLSRAETATVGGGGERRIGGAATEWALSTINKKDGWNHRWTSLVVICVECRRYAARWLCDDCEEVYCVGCYASVHRHGTKVKHGAEKLPYYTADLHMEYAMACRQRSRKERDKEAQLLWMEEQARAKDVAAVKIQACWRGRVGRIEGRALLKAGRAEHREAWRQRKRDDRKRNAIWFEGLDLLGLAPNLASDRLDEKVLKRVPRMARKRPRKYIALNREDDAWVPGKLEERKGVVKRGFNFGKFDELKDQAKRGGVRLPGGHSMRLGHRCIYTDPAYNMAEFLKPKNVIRVHGELFNVEAVDGGRIRIDRVWHKQDANHVLLYKMVLSRRQKLLLRLSRALWTSQAVQYGIQMTLVLEEGPVNRLIRKAAKHYKRKRQKRLYALTKSTLKKSEEHIRALKFKLNTAQFGLDNSLTSGASNADSKEADPNRSIAETAESALAWVEDSDEASGRPLWRNTKTGEVTSIPPRGMKNIEKMTEDLETQKQMLRAKKAKKR
ncbi:unnamed protein product [Scytosiphon promiscuus]